MLFEDKLHDIINTIESDKLLLAPVEFAWAIAFDPFGEYGYTTLNSLKPFIDDTIFLMVKDLDMMLNLHPQLHPRVETLLSYHRRPLGIICPRYISKSLDFKMKTALCLSFDPYTNQIIKLLDRPLACVYLKTYDRMVNQYDKVHTSILKTVDYTARHRRKESLAGLCPLKASYDEEGNLDIEGN